MTTWPERLGLMAGGGLFAHGITSWRSGEWWDMAICIVGMACLLFLTAQAPDDDMRRDMLKGMDPDQCSDPLPHPSHILMHEGEEKECPGVSQ